MADSKQMEYTGSGLEVVLPDTGEVTDLSKGDVVGYDQFGGSGFFSGRTDFKEHKTTAKAAASKKGKATDG